MAKFDYGRQIEYGIRFNLDKSALTQLQAELNKIQNTSFNALKVKMDTADIEKVRQAYGNLKSDVNQLQSVLDRTFNSNLGTFNLRALNQELNKLDLKRIQKDFNAIGATGANSFRQIQTSIITQNAALRQSNELLDKMGTTFKNTVRYGISSSIFNNLVNSIQKAYDYTVKLDSSLNDIRIVTDKSAESMNKFALQANKAAQGLGKSTRDYTEASLIYYQQGLNDEETAARTETTLKAANVTGQSTREVSEQLTAVWNGYKVSAAETEHYVDKLAATAAATAADLEELSVGMSKVASAANIMGVDVDQLNAQLATIVSVTREAPESIGTSLKTIYARMSDIEAGLDGETSLGKYTADMADMGFNVLDVNGKLKDMGEVIEEIGGKWSSMSREQQVALAQTVAGTRQYSRLMSLFDNWDMYIDTLEISKNSLGTLQHQQDIYMESTQAHINQLNNAWERLYNAMINKDAITGVTDGLTLVVKLLAQFTESIGGGIGVLNLLGTTAIKIFSTQIARGLTIFSHNIKAVFNDAQNQHFAQAIADQFAQIGNNNEVQKLINGWTQSYSDYYTLLDAGQRKEYGNAIQEATNAQNEKAIWDEKIAQAQKYYDTITQGKSKVSIAELNPDSEGNFVIQKIQDEQKKLQETLRLFDEVPELDQDEGNFKPFLENLRKELYKIIPTSNEARKSINEVKATLKEFSKQDIINPKQQTKFDDAIAKGRKVLEEEIQISKQSEENIDKQIQGEGQKLDLRAQIWKDHIEEINKQLEKVSLTQSIVSLAGSFGQLATAISMVPKIKDIWDNETLSGGEKLLQTMTSLISIFTMFGSSIKGIATQLPILSAKLGLVEAEAVKAGTAGIAAWGPLLLYIGLLVVAIGGLVASCKGLSDWFHQDATAAAEAAEKAQELTEAYNEAKQKAEELKNTLSDYSGAVKQLSELKKGTKEYAEALNEVNEKAKQIRDEYDLYDKSSYKNGVLTFDEDAWYDIQTQAQEKAAKAESRMYSGKILANNAELKSQQTDSKRSIFWESYKNGLTSFSNPIYGGTVDQVTNGLVQLKAENEDFYLQLKNGSASMSEWVSALDGNAWGLNFLSEEIDKNKEEFFKLAEATEKVKNANLQYYESINKTYLAGKYGERLASMSYNEKGEFDEAIYTQLLAALGQSAPQQQATKIQQAQDLKNQGRTVNLGGDVASSQEAWSHEVEQGLGKALGMIVNPVGMWEQTGNLNKKLTNDLKKAQGISDKDLENLIGTSELKTDEDLAKAYAQLTGVDISKATKKGKKYVDDTGETVLDFSSNEARGKMRAAVYNEASSKASQQKAQEEVEEGTDQVIKLLQKASMAGSEAGKEYGANFTLAVANAMADSDKTFDFSQYFGSISPEEAEKIRGKSNQEILDMFGYSEEDVQKLGFESGQQFTENFKAGFSEENYQWDPAKAVEQVLAGQDEQIKEKGLDKEELADYAEYLMSISNGAEDAQDGINDLSDEMEHNADAGVIVAQSIMRMNNGLEKLAKSQEDWIDVLKDSGKESEEYFDALKGIRDAIGDVLDLSEDTEKYLDGDFFVKNADLIEKAANGSAEAIDKLRVATTDAIVAKIIVDNELSGEEIATLQSSLNNIQNQIPDIVVGTELNLDGMSQNEAAFLEECQRIISTAHMTADQANAFFESMGFEAQFATEEKEIKKKGHATITETTVDSVAKATTPDGQGEYTYPSKMSTRTYPGEAYEYTDYVEVMAMTTDGSAPKIQSLTKKASGSANNYSSKNKGGGSSSGKKGGGGGKGGGSSKKADTMDPLKEEIDRYHDVNVKLEQIETTLDRLEDAEDKAFGGDLVKNYNKQIEALNNQITVTQQKLGIAADEMKELQGKLAGSGVRFNSDGTIGNYAAALQAQENYVNGIINHYNSLGADAQESYKETVEQAKKNFDEFKKNLERYDELVTDEIPDLQDQIQEAIDKITEKNIEKFKMEVDLRLDIAEAERDWNEFKKKVIDQIDDDDILGNAKARIEDLKTYLNDLDTGEVQALGKHVQETLDELRAFDKGLDNVYGRERSQSLEDLEDYFDKLKDALEEIVEIQDELQEDVLDQMDAVQDKIDDQVDTYEAISDLIEHDMTLIQLTLGDEAYTQLTNYYNAQQDNYNKQLDFQRQQVEYWKNQMDAVEQGSEQFEAAREKWADAVADWNDLVEDAVENLQDKLANTINEIFKNLNDNLTNNKGLQYISDEFDIVGERTEQFLDEINRLQGIADLADKYQDAINNTDNLSAQKKLNAAMQEQLDALKNADKLSEKDIERAQKRYELTVAQVALEEAQAQKNTLRLRRDTQGNYRYQYVADDEAVNDAQNKLREAYNSLYNFDKERYIDNLNEAYDTWNDYQEAMAEAAQINDPELRAQKEALIQQEYGEIINGIVEQNEKIRTDLRESAFMDLANLKQEEYDTYMNMTQEEQDVILNGLIPQWDDGIQQMISAIKDEGGFEPTTIDAFDNIQDAAEEYDQAIQNIQADINETVGDVLNGEDQIIEVNQALTMSNDGVIESYKAELEAVQDLAAGVNDLANAYKDELQAARDAHDYLAKQKEEAAKAAAEAEKGKTAAKETVATPLPETKPAQTTTAAPAQTNSNPRAGYRLGGQAYTVVSGDTLSGIARRFYGKASLYTEIWQHNKDHLRGRNANYIYPGEVVYLDTGGYTGTWNSRDAKAAFLHEKELVLNAKDTRNLLDTVAIMRNITAAVGQTTLERLSGATSGGYVANGSGNGSVLEQDVHITANFPNVKSAIEIETALNNLTNAASQYIGKK